MALRLRWRGLSALATALLFFSACSSATTSHAVAGATATTGPITLTTNRTSYTSGDAVGVTVRNSSKSSFYTQDGKSSCTIVQLQRFDSVSGVWKAVDPCNGAQAARALLIAENSSVPFTLAPTSVSDINTWEPGTYRVVVLYTTKPDGVSATQEAHSAVFTITSS